MQFKVALVSLFAALAIASPLEKRCTANGGSCTQLSQCCSGNCEYDASIGLVCKAASKKRDAQPELEGTDWDYGKTKREETAAGETDWDYGKREATPVPETLLEKRCTANGGVCNFNNAECCSGNCLYSIGNSNAYCAATSKKREETTAADEDWDYGKTKREDTSAGETDWDYGKREAMPELEKRCTANGGSCTQLSQCCSGNCEYDSSIGLVCKA